MFTNKESVLVNRVTLTALRLIILGSELCSFHLSMSSGPFVSEACRVFRLRMQKREFQEWMRVYCRGSDAQPMKIGAPTVGLAVS
jgi:hypothetical protein